MRNKENLKFVIVGHVDHGKSTLIGRLLYDTDSISKTKLNEIKQVCESLGKPLELGYIIDSLEEERIKNITIDTSQIFFRTNKREYTIIDAPGHVEFLKNMITGASQAEAAILMIDANEGIREQTKRHSYLLKILGINQIIVSINKMDLINYSEIKFNEIKKKITDFFNKINLPLNYVIPVSAKKGDNIAKKSNNIGWYNGPTILKALDEFKQVMNKNENMRFSVQDVYNLNKKIIVGRVESGILKKGEKIILLPSKEEFIIKSIEEYMKDTNEAEAGKAVGLTIEGAERIKRGDIISDLNLPNITNKFNAHLFWADESKLKKGEEIFIKISTQKTKCFVKEFKKIFNPSTLDEKENLEILETNDVAEVVIETSKPVVVEEFIKNPELGRFVLQKKDICAGGIII